MSNISSWAFNFVLLAGSSRKVVRATELNVELGYKRSLEEPSGRYQFLISGTPIHNMQCASF